MQDERNSAQNKCIKILNIQEDNTIHPIKYSINSAYQGGNKKAFDECSHIQIDNSRNNTSINACKNSIKDLKCFSLSWGIKLVCSIAVIFQLKECFLKFHSPDVLTRIRLVVNERLPPPALTICRHPAFKEVVYQEYNLNFQELRYCKQFPWNSTTLDQLWTEATYESNSFLSEVLYQHYMHFDREFHLNSNIASSIYGRCVTVTRKGNIEKGSIIRSILNFPYMDNTSIFSIYIHDPADSWTDIEIDWIQTPVVRVRNSQDIKIGIRVQYMHALNLPGNPCDVNLNYSISHCMMECIRNFIAKKVKCHVPWMIIPGTPECSNYTTFSRFVSQHQHALWNLHKICYCKRPCQMKKFLITDINDNPSFAEYDYPVGVASIKMTTNLIEHLEEVLAYDGSQFLSDVGGSLDFLLGISVLNFLDLVFLVLERVKSFLTRNMYDKHSRH